MFHAKRNPIYKNYPSGAQNWLLIELLKINLPLARNEIPNVDKIVSKFIMWEEWENIAKRLNSLGLVHKTGKEWKQYWYYLRSCIEKKISLQANKKFDYLQKRVSNISMDDDMMANGDANNTYGNVKCALINANANGDGMTDEKNFESKLKFINELASKDSCKQNQLNSVINGNLNKESKIKTHKNFNPFCNSDSTIGQLENDSSMILQNKSYQLENRSSKINIRNETFENEQMDIRIIRGSTISLKDSKMNKLSLANLDLKKEKLQIKREKLQLLKEALDMKKRILTLLETNTNSEIIRNIARDEINIKISIKIK